MTPTSEIYFALHQVLLFFDAQQFEAGMDLLHGVHETLQ